MNLRNKSHFDITRQTSWVIPVLLLFVSLMAACAAHAVQCSNQPGATRVWSNPATWEPAGVPGAGSTVELIDCGVFLDVPATVANLTLGGSGNGGSIDNQGNPGGNRITVTNRLEMSRGGIGGGFNLEVVIPSGATLVFSGPGAATKIIGGLVTIQNAGRIEWPGGAVSFNGILNNSGTFAITGDAGFGSALRSGVINNTGRIVKEGGSGITQFGGFTPETSQINTTINNNGGVVEVASGTIEIGGGNGKGEFKIAAGKMLLVGHGGVYTFEEPTIFTGGGTCLIRFGTPRFAGNIDIASTLEVAQDSAGFQTGNGTTITEATFHGIGLLLWKGPGINGKLTLASDFRTIVDGVPKTVTNLINEGTMSWLGGSIGERGGQYFYNEGTLNVLAAGEFLGYASYFYNSGTVNTFGGGTSTSYAAVFENAGHVNIGGFGKAGILEILLPDGFTQKATGTLYMEVGGANPATPQFDQLIGNSKIINGTLFVDVINDFIPATGARFTLINSQTGQFSRVSTPGVNRFAVEYPGNAKTDLVSLSDAPIPLKLYAAGRDLGKNESPDRAAEGNAVNETVPEWSYGYRSAAASTALTLFTPQQHINDGSGLHGWIANGQTTLGVNTKNTPIIFDTGSGNTKALLPTQLYLSPGAGNEFLVVRWTAPANGDYRVMARWVDIDQHGGNGATAYLMKNGQEQFAKAFQSTATSTGRAWMRSHVLSLNTGDFLDFVVGSNGEPTFDATAFNALVRRVPKVTITSPASGVQLNGGAQNVTVNVNFEDEVPASKITLKVDDAENVVSDGSAPYSLTTLLKPGYHRITAVATDSGGAVVESPEIAVIVAPAVSPQGALLGTKQGDSSQVPAAPATGKLFFSSGSGSWNDPATWGNQGGVPLRWDYAIIQNGHHVTLDLGIQVRDVTINGKLSSVPGAPVQYALDVYGTLHATGQIENLDLYINGPAGKFLILGTSPVLRSVNIFNQGKFSITADQFNGEEVTIENRGNMYMWPPIASQGPLVVPVTGFNQLGGQTTLGVNTLLRAPDGVTINGLLRLSPDYVPLLSEDGGGVVSNHGGSLISDNGAALIGLDGGTLIGLDGGTLIGLDGGTLVGPDGFPLIGNAGGTFVSEHGGAFQSTQGIPASTAQTSPTPGTITLTGGTITGTGEIRGNVINQGGFIAPGNSAGGIVVNGNYTQQAGGTLVLELGGKTFFDDFSYDVFQVAGTATLGGNLVVKTINGYTPASGDTVSALLYGSHAGNFATISSNAQVTLGAEAAQVTTIGTNPQGPRALNISTRLQIQSGDNALFAGFIVTGPAGSTKKVLIRGIGPSLAQFGVPGTIPDPFLELHTSSSTITNDNWQQAPNANEIPPGFSPNDPRESIIIATLGPGNYSAILKGAHGETGVGLAEVYDLDPTSSAQLANIATRGLVQTGDTVLIGGFIIAGTQPAKVLVRAIGPSLSAFGVQGALQDTTLEVHDSNGGAISNDNWRESDEAAIAATGIPPSHNNEAAVLAILAPGNYTAVVRGADDTTGIAVVEAYNVSQ